MQRNTATLYAKQPPRVASQRHNKVAGYWPAACDENRGRQCARKLVMQLSTNSKRIFDKGQTDFQYAASPISFKGIPINC